MWADNETNRPVGLSSSCRPSERGGSWFSYMDSRIGQGREAVKALLRDNPELCDEITDKISKAMSSMPASEIEAKEESREQDD